MDPCCSGQDVLRCHICETPMPPLYCDVCIIHLCKTCVGEHILDESKEHKVVPFKKRGSTYKCPKHCTKQCLLYCEQCDIPICLLCISCGEHENHKKVDILESLKKKKTFLQKDLQELEKTIYPQYQEIASFIVIQKSAVEENSQKLKEAIDKQGVEWHNEIDTIIRTLKSDLDNMNSEHLVVLNNKETEITITISEITKGIENLKVFLESNDLSLISAYESINDEFRRLPQKHPLSLPSFTPKKISSEQIYQQFGFLSKLSISLNESASNVEPSTPDKLLIDVPHLISNIDLKSGIDQKFLVMSCLTTEQIWTRDQENMMRLYNVQGRLVKSIRTKSGNSPQEIAVARSGDLLYIDCKDKAVNIVKNTQIEEVIRLELWIPRNVCSTSCGDILVIMVSYDNKQSKVVRYSDKMDKQTIQFNDKGQPLYSFLHSKCICENQNLDICVSDSDAHAVVVVNRIGKHRFTYNGRPSATEKSFSPRGITTDSQCRILTADQNNHCIHILDRDGQFLGFIDNCHLQSPYSICVDTNDNLIVGECSTGNVKTIKYQA